MKSRESFVLAVMLSVFVGCGSQDQAAKPAAEPETAVAVPTTDLHSAVVLGDLETIRQHVAAATDLNVLEPSRASTPLITAAAIGKAEAAKLLIEAGADLNYQNNDGSTALHTAAFFGRIEIVRALLAKGADKTLKNKMSGTPLEIVELPFEAHKAAYEAIGAGLKPAGFEPDLEHLATARLEIAEMLK